ncbi:ATP-grasp fold amidoligase family protein [Mesonia sp. HuA40]|uniref:ATP-grasp fold amidoligase family protein n=1 Tax=Mesonia sp. HuA40 TaxID=2602761 RepID=UPI0011C9678D|nr:ATP-grasp fold amidoligase family protein [Mesonia sp. HuA40]TXK74300.1 glycosyltransferase [Mesonia sp. HuA40]
MKFLPPEIYMPIYYEYYLGKKLDLKNPVEFNQKIQWLKTYYHPDILTKLVDKYAVREYVKEKVGEQYLNDLIAVYDKASKVNFDELPNKFVIKGVHGFHFNLIVKDKTKLNRNKARFLMNKWMHKNQYYRGGLEWAYKNVPPRLIAEKYLEEMDKDVILDYKFFCFNGEPKFVQIDFERGVNDQRAFYDLDWKKLDLHKKSVKIYEGELEKPNNFEEMIQVARTLADKFPFVRVDLYSIKNKTIFGEMTFYPADGRSDFYPAHYNKILGDMIKLPILPKNKKEIKEV